MIFANLLDYSCVSYIFHEISALVHGTKQAREEENDKQIIFMITQKLFMHPQLNSVQSAIQTYACHLFVAAKIDPFS